MKVLLAIDGSQFSEVAIAELTRIPLPAASIIYVITVEVPIEPSLLKGAPTAFDSTVQQLRTEAWNRLRDAANKLQRLAPKVKVRPKMLEGHPKHAIVSEAERLAVDLIVVGSHGYGPVRRFFLGSVSQFVAHYAHCSVLIARSKAADASISEPSTTN